MEKNNPLYKNQGIHTISCIFTVDQGDVKVLLIKRKKEPYKDHWILVGGAIYNNEDINDGVRREILEKTGIYDIELEQFKAFGDPYRSPDMRMVAIGYIGVISSKKIKLLKESRNTSDANWFSIKEIPKLGYDHEQILEEGIKVLQNKILKTNILKSLFDETFTLPELQRTYEAILGIEFDRRNFRKKFLSLGLIEDTNKEQVNKIGKPSKLYRFKKNIEIDRVF